MTRLGGSYLPLGSNGRFTSDSGSMIPTVRTDSRKLSPSTQNYDTDNPRQRVGGGHVWLRPLDSPNGKLGLAQVGLVENLWINCAQNAFLSTRIRVEVVLKNRTTG